MVANLLEICKTKIYDTSSNLYNKIYSFNAIFLLINVTPPAFQTYFLNFCINKIVGCSPPPFCINKIVGCPTPTLPI